MTELQELYFKAGAGGMSYRKVYAKHKGPRAPTFAAWQDGKKSIQRAILDNLIRARESGDAEQLAATVDSVIDAMSDLLF